MALLGTHKVQDVMTKRPRAVSEETTAVEAADIMATEDVGALPVIRDGKLAGIVTDRDLTVRVLARNVDPRSTRIGDIATDEIVTVDPQDDLETAIDLMARHQVRRLAVVEDGDQVVGILAQADIARSVGEKQAGQVVGDISEPSGGPRLSE